MKKRKQILMALVLLISGITLGQNLNQVEVSLKMEDQLQILIPALAEANQVRLLDATNVELYAEELDEKDFKRNLSLANLPLGDYRIEIDGKNQLVIQHLSKTKQGLSLANQGVVFKPSIKAFGKNQELVRLTFKNPTPKRSSVKVYDSSGALVTKFRNDENYFNKVLDFSDVPHGEYSIAVEKAGKNYIEKVYIGE